MNYGEENQNDVVDDDDFATATTETASTTLFFMLPVTLLEYMLVEFLDVRSLVTLGKCHDLDEKVTEIALSSKTWDRLESQIKEGTSVIATAKSAMDRVLRYHIANEYASNIESKIITSIKVLQKDKLIWNHDDDAVQNIPKWTEEPFRSIDIASVGFEYFVRISMLKFNNNNSSSSSIESQETTLVWKGFLRYIEFEKDEWNGGDFTLKLKFPGGEVGIPWGLCGFDDFGESWGETEGPMITVVAVDNCLTGNTAIDQVVAGGNNVEPLCCFVFWDAFANDWTEYEFDRMDNNRLIKRSAGFPMLSTPRSNRLGCCAPFSNAENDHGYYRLDVRTAKLRTGRDTNGTGCRLLKLDVRAFVRDN